MTLPACIGLPPPTGWRGLALGLALDLVLALAFMDVERAEAACEKGARAEAACEKGARGREDVREDVREDERGDVCEDGRKDKGTSKTPVNRCPAVYYVSLGNVRLSLGESAHGTA
jgi:hypothetical protein